MNETRFDSLRTSDALLARRLTFQPSTIPTEVETDADYEKFIKVVEKWNRKADQGNVMAYIWPDFRVRGPEDGLAQLKRALRSMLTMHEACNPAKRQYP